MNYRTQFCFVGFLLLGTLTFGDIANAQGVFNYPPPDAYIYDDYHEGAPQDYYESSSGTTLNNDCWNSLYEEVEYWDQVISESEYDSPEYYYAKQMRDLATDKQDVCFE
jgi:hypothetical protein